MIPLLMILLSIIPALFIYNSMQENFDAWPALDLPDFFSYASFICVGLILILSMFMIKRNKS